MYTIGGYVADADTYCPACMVAAYSGRVENWRSKRSGLTNRKRIVNGYYRANERRGNYGSLPHNAKWVDIVEYALSFGDAHIFDNEGNEIVPLMDNEECDYQMHCTVWDCQREIPCTIICHKGTDAWHGDQYIGEDSLCPCEDCVWTRDHNQEVENDDTVQ